MAEKKINPFTGEEEDAPAHLINLSPADQRIAAAPPHTDPLPELIEKGVNARGDAPGVDVETHVGPTMTQDPIPGQTPLPFAAVHETPNTEIAVHLQDEYKVPDQGEEPPNDKLLDDKNVETRIGTESDGVDYPGLDTKAYNESLERRREAEEEGKELPEIEPPVPGDQASDTEQASQPKPRPKKKEAQKETDEHAELMELNKQELKDEAADLGIEGRSSMNKEELADAIEDAESR